MPQTPRGNRYIVTCIDYFTKWPEALPLKDKSADSVAHFLLDTSPQKMVSKGIKVFVGNQELKPLVSLPNYPPNKEVYCTVLYRFGCANVVISNQRREFVNTVNELLMKLTGVDHRISSAYHPQSNGLIEHFNQTLQNSLYKSCSNPNKDWDIVLPSVLFAIRTCVQKSTKFSPFKLMFNRHGYYMHALILLKKF